MCPPLYVVDLAPLTGFQRHFFRPASHLCLGHFCVTCRPRASFFSVQPWIGCPPSRSIFRNPHTSGQAGRTIYHPRRTIEPLRRVAPVCARNDVITDVILRCNPAHPRRRQRADLRLYRVAPKTEDAAFDCPRLSNARTSLQNFCHSLLQCHLMLSTANTSILLTL